MQALNEALGIDWTKAHVKVEEIKNYARKSV